MKYILFLLISISTNCIVVAQKSETIFDSLDTHYLMKLFFDNPKFDASSEMYIWKPNYHEHFVFPVSEAGQCFTKVDTMMYYKTVNNTKCVVIVFGTYKYNYAENGFSLAFSDCGHCTYTIGIALLYQRPDKKWRLYHLDKGFQKVGVSDGYGQRDRATYKLVKIADKWTCLMVRDPIKIEFGYESLYLIEEYSFDQILSKIFSYPYYQADKVYIDEKDELNSRPSIETKLEFIDIGEDYYAIKLIRRINNNLKKYKTTEIKYYAYSKEDVRYLLKD